MTADGTMLTTDAEGGVTEGRVLVDDVPDAETGATHMKTTGEGP